MRRLVAFPGAVAGAVPAVAAAHAVAERRRRDPGRRPGAVLARGHGAVRGRWPARCAGRLVMVKLFARVVGDMLRSNVEVTWAVLTRRPRDIRSGFVRIPLELTGPERPGGPGDDRHVHAGHRLGAAVRRQARPAAARVLARRMTRPVVAAHQASLRAPAAGDLRMSPLLSWALLFALGCLTLAMMLALVRMILGPRAEDRVLAFDCLYLNTMLVILTLGLAVPQQLLLRGGAAHRPVRLRGLIGDGEVPPARGDHRMTTTSPLWVDALTAALVVVGALAALIGSFGLLRADDASSSASTRPASVATAGDMGRDARDRGSGVLRDGATVPARGPHPGVRRADRAGHHRVPDARRAVQGPPARLLRRPAAAGCVTIRALTAYRVGVKGDSLGSA